MYVLTTISIFSNQLGFEPGPLKKEPGSLILDLGKLFSIKSSIVLAVIVVVIFIKVLVFWAQPRGVADALLTSAEFKDGTS